MRTHTRGGSSDWKVTIGVFIAAWAVVGGCVPIGGALFDDEDDDAGSAVTACATDAGAIPLKEAKLIIEHNATDEDTGFQGFVDSEGWRRMLVSGPDGVVLAFEAGGMLAGFGATELFFETVEPPNAETPIEEVLARLPAGDYTFAGQTPDGQCTLGTATLTHDIPAGPELLGPAAGAVVDRANLVASWKPVTQTLDGRPVTIIRYQLIVQKDELPHPNAIGKIGLSVHVPANVTSVTIPPEILEPATAYKWEVLAIEASGNQTLSSSEFSTQ